MITWPIDADASGLPTEPIRAGFGRGLVAAGEQDERVVALCADLTESTQMLAFKEKFGRRFIQVGVAEQNLATVAAGLAHAGRIPFATSYAAFSPGRNWEQIKTTASMNDLPVKIVGSHAGLNVGKDGATHQMLEDIALMRVMPHMVVITPADSREAERATLALAQDPRPGYLRLARDATPVFTNTDALPFQIGAAYQLAEGSDVTLISTGTMTYHATRAARGLTERGYSVDHLHVPTIKPLDAEAIIASAERTGLVFTVEEGQAAGGLGGSVAELLSEELPTRVHRIGVADRYGESGSPDELLAHFGLDADGILARILTKLIH